MKTHTSGADQFIELIVPVKGMKHINIMWTADIQMNKDVIIAVVIGI